MALNGLLSAIQNIMRFKETPFGVFKFDDTNFGNLQKKDALVWPPILSCSSDTSSQKKAERKDSRGFQIYECPTYR